MNESPDPAGKGVGAAIAVVVVILVAWFALSAWLGNEDAGGPRVDCTTVGATAEYGEEC